MRTHLIQNPIVGLPTFHQKLTLNEITRYFYCFVLIIIFYFHFPQWPGWGFGQTLSS